MRDYGLPLLVWGGEDECGHEWGDTIPRTHQGGGNAGVPPEWQRPSRAAHTGGTSGQFCHKCGAWLGSLGLEPTPELYVEHIVEVFREVKRVLRDDGTLWLNMGDSYATSMFSYNYRDKGHYNRKSPIEHQGWLGTDLESRKSHIGKAKVVQQMVGLKPKDLCGLPWRVVLALQADGWWLRSDIIWHKPNCLSGGTWLYVRSQKGDMPMTVKDMVRLGPATVKLWNGNKWTQVLAWHENPRRNLRGPSGQPVEIELRSGERIGCTPDHLWPTQRGNLRADELRVGDVIRSTMLPEPSFCYCEYLPAQLIGWFVGIYIAEGSRSGDAIQISCHVKEDRFGRLCELADAFHGTCKMHPTGGNAATINLYGATLRGILDDYVAGKTAKNKHLTTKAWQRDNVFLDGVLAGYLEGDGHDDWPNRRWRIGFTRNYRWARDLRTICARLDIQLRLKPTFSVKTATGKRHPSFRGEIRYQRSTHLNAKADMEIVRIGRSKGRRFWDITVEDEPHLFALASGVLTHNCMPESVRDRPTKSHEYVFLLAKNKRYYYDQDAIREPHSEAGLKRLESPTPAQFGGANKHEGYGTRLASGRPYTQANPLGRNKRTVWTIPTHPFPGAHFAVFPLELVEPMIKAGTSEKGACPECGKAWLRRVKKAARQRIPRYPSDERIRDTKMSGPPSWDTYETVGWQPACSCGLPDGFQPDDFELVETPTGERVGDDPTLLTGRAGYNRPRGPKEGKRAITRYEQRKYAEQLRNSPRRAEMEVQAGSAFEHYIRTDKSGARPIPPDLLGAWLEQGWLEQVEVPEWEPPDSIPCLVLDLFAGAGTTSLVAEKLGRDSVLIDLSPEYAEMSKQRILKELGPMFTKITMEEME